MNKLILAAAAVATVSVTAGCKQTTVVRTVHEPVEVVDTRTVVHERTDVHVYEHREPTRVIEEVHVVKPAPVYVPQRRVEVYHDRAPVRPVPPAHSNSRIIREYEDHRPLPRHARERDEDKHWIQQTPVGVPPRPIKHQPESRQEPRVFTLHQSHDKELRDKRRNPVVIPPRNVKRPPVQPAPRTVTPYQARDKDRYERRTPEVIPPRNVQRQPVNRPLPRAMPSHPVRPQEVRQERRAHPAPAAHINARQPNGSQNQASQHDNRNANDRRRTKDDKEQAFAESHASERGKERSANNRRY